MGLSRQEYWSGLPFPTPGEVAKSLQGRLKPPQSTLRIVATRWQQLSQLPTHVQFCYRKLSLNRRTEHPSPVFPFQFSPSGGLYWVSLIERFFKALPAATIESGFSRDRRRKWVAVEAQRPISPEAVRFFGAAVAVRPVALYPEKELTGRGPSQLRARPFGFPCCTKARPSRRSRRNPRLLPPSVCAAVRPRPEAQSVAAPACNAKYSHEEKGAVNGEERVGEDQHEIDYLCQLHRSRHPAPGCHH